MSVLSQRSERTDEVVGTGIALVLPRVNLLPPEIADRMRFRRIQYGLGAGVLAAAGVVALLFVGAMGSVDDANAELTRATGTGAGLQAQTAKYADVRAVYAQAAGAEAMLTRAMGEEVRFSQFLNDLSLTKPANVWLTQATFAQEPVAPTGGATVPSIGNVTFAAMAFEHDDVATWLEALAKQKGYSTPYLSASTKSLIGKREVVEHSSVVLLTPEALSGRYTAPAGG
ncbi:MAG: Fimbrial assembly family protein [Frankiales bacterium]|nr:Fimbrial assembly family protein [Frankiales bacterium]